MCSMLDALLVGLPCAPCSESLVIAKVPPIPTAKFFPLVPRCDIALFSVSLHETVCRSLLRVWSTVLTTCTLSIKGIIDAGITWALLMRSNSSVAIASLAFCQRKATCDRNI